MIEDTFAHRLQKALDYNKMKAIDLANKTGINKSLISNYLSGNFKAKQDKLTQMAEVLNVAEAWLMGYDVRMDREWLRDTDIENATMINNFYIEKEEVNILIPILEKISSTISIENEDEVKGYVEIPKKLTENSLNLFCFKIKDESMEPDYKKGDILIVRKQDDFNSGDDCIITINNNNAIFVRVIKQNDSIILKPLNNKYEPAFFNKEEIINNYVKIIGVAIEVRRKLKGGV